MLLHNLNLYQDFARILVVASHERKNNDCFEKNFLHIRHGTVVISSVVILPGCQLDLKLMKEKVVAGPFV